MTSRAGRGRPARYHDATCRQRAHRARLVATPERVALLAVAERVEHAACVLRAVITAGQDPVGAVAGVLAAVADLRGPEGVTDLVTEVADVADVVVDTPPDSSPAVTEPVTVAPSPELRRLGPTERVDPDAVRLERSPDYGVSGVWRVLADQPRGVTLLGTLARGRRGWHSRDDHLVDVGGGPWRTRRGALVALVDLYVRPRRRRRR